MKDQRRLGIAGSAVFSAPRREPSVFSPRSEASPDAGDKDRAQRRAIARLAADRRALLVDLEAALDAWEVDASDDDRERVAKIRARWGIGDRPASSDES